MQTKKVTIEITDETLRAQKRANDFLSRNDLFQLHEKPALGYLSKQFSLFEQCSQLIIQDCQKLAEHNPAFVIEVGAGFVNAKDVKTWLILSSKDDLGSHLGKVQWLAKCWDHPKLFRFAAYLLSSQRAPYEKLVGPKAIFKHLGLLGLKAPHIEALRKLRNAASHSYYVEGDCLIISDGEELRSISLEQIDEVYVLVRKIFDWWLTLMLAVLPWAAPRFGILALSGIGIGFRRHGWTKYQQFLEGLKLFHPTAFAPLTSRSSVSTSPTSDALEPALAVSLAVDTHPLIKKYEESLAMSARGVDERLADIGQIIHEAAQHVKTENEKSDLEKAAKFFQEFGASKRPEVADALQSGYSAILALVN